MAWYDWFSNVYDASLEALYAEAREAAAAALDLEGARRILDVPTGTGQSLDALVARLGAGASVLAVDLSEGMLAKARKRAEAKGFAERVELAVGDVMTLADVGSVDRLHVFLGMTTFPDMDAAFANLWGLLAPGGRAVVVDTHAEKLGFQGRMVNWIARADIRRKAWEPLEARCEGFDLRELPPNPKYGGALMLASGTKPLSG